ncbi:diacylglycerol/lipid kinase family protein [Pseudooceanicola aestuarii]|uniref:diacylglycerol/lipid kinase family protein n=1 Tax=Pseudooceanicola aestuarii TaxID=2697319 RepID=UPI0013D82720|nr:diacylglycerol kinase family protein [Pseudooceanicola aestuarii]
MDGSSPLADTPPARPDSALGPRQIVLLANRDSGTNSRDAQAIDRAVQAMGPDRARIVYWTPGSDPEPLVAAAIAEGADCIVAAGGDGTAMAVAQAMLGKPCAMGVLPLGTFNFFARGLGLSETPEDAARAVICGQPHDIRIGMVNGQVFLNNASLGVYPAILKERESIYRRWGRRRIMAHWSVAKTFLRFQRPMRLRITVNGDTLAYRTPLLFVARSAYQLDLFDLKGEAAIHDDAFAVLIGRGDTRWKLFRLAWRLVTRQMRPGRDYALIPASDLSVETGSKHTLVAFDGEKTRARAPFRFHMTQDTLRIMLPDPQARPSDGGAQTAA